MKFQELNNDQRREMINSQQRFERCGRQRASDAQRGSFDVDRIQGSRISDAQLYDKAGMRKQTSLGLRSSETEKIKSDFEARRVATADRLKNMARDDGASSRGQSRARSRSSSVDRRAHHTRPRWVRPSWVGHPHLGTNAIYAYEAASGVRIDPGLAATEDIDLLLDAAAD